MVKYNVSITRHHFTKGGFCNEYNTKDSNSRDFQ